MEKIIITIGRQFGSGGREIGKKLAEKFGISYYDKNYCNWQPKKADYARNYSKKRMKKHPEVFCKPWLWDFR